jgi:hypothetical protein
MDTRHFPCAKIGMRLSVDADLILGNSFGYFASAARSRQTTIVASFHSHERDAK